MSSVLALSITFKYFAGLFVSNPQLTFLQERLLVVKRLNEEKHPVGELFSDRFGSFTDNFSSERFLQVFLQIFLSHEVYAKVL